MKKMKFVKIACAVLTMCLITTCAIGTTLAKYTTGTTASDTARVAKWGVEVSASGTMFGKTYQNTIIADNDTSATVQSSNIATFNDKVVAPGTLNDTGIQIKLAGEPEVDFGVVATATNIKDIVLKANTYGVMVLAYGINNSTDVATEPLYTLGTDGSTYTKATEFVAGTAYYRLTEVTTLTEDYYPIEWKGKVVVDIEGGSANGEWTNTFDTLEDATDALVGGGLNATYQSNTKVSLVYTLTWAWAFDVNDGADTVLGNIAAGVETTKVVKLTNTGTYVLVTADDYNLKVGCDINVRATQID